MPTVKYSLETLPKIRQEDIEKIRLIQDKDIDCSDILPLTDEFWANAQPSHFYRQSKQQVTLRIDKDILDFFKKTGKGYQTRLNAVLRTYMEAHK